MLENKKAALTIQYLLTWMIFVLIYFSVVIGVLWIARESVWDSLNYTEQFIAAILILTPMFGAISDLMRQARE